MKPRIVLAPNLNSNELKINLALHGVNCINLRVFSSVELARYILMCLGVNVTSIIVDSREETTIIASVTEGEEYFGKTSYSDIQSLAYAIRRMRMLVDAEDEERAIADSMLQGLFKAKNNAIVSVYRKYMHYLAEHNLFDSVSLIRKAISCCSIIDNDFFVISECPLSPLEKKLIDKVSGGMFKTIKFTELYKESDKPIVIKSIRNCYGASNEVESIVSDIYSNKKLDECTVAVSDPGTYGQLFFDYALIYDIPMTFGSGIPIINSNPAKLLSLYYQWTTTGFFGADALRRVIFSRSFNRSKLMELFPVQDDDFHWSSFYRYLGDICFTNNKISNHDKFEAYKKAVEDEAQYTIEGESKEYKEYCHKVMCLPLLELMADELALPAEVFVSKYAYIRHDDSKVSTKMLTSLDIASCSAIYNELVSIRESGASQTEEDTILNVLKMNVMSQQSKPGHLHVTSVDKAISCIRKNLYIAGLSASKYPGSPKENYLLLDSDLDLFGEAGKELKSGARIERKIKTVMQLVELASAIGSDIQVSYSGLNVAELKRDNASSLIYELYSKMIRKGASFDDLEKAIQKIDYFEPAISSTRLIGKAYIDGKYFPQIDPVKDDTKFKWNLDKEYSPTTLETFFSCPRRFMLSQILGIPDEDETDPFEVLSARDIGTLAHTLMEHLADDNPSFPEFLALSREFFDRTLDEHPPLIPDKIDAVRHEFLEMMETAYNGDPHRKIVLKEEDIHCVHPTGVKLHGFPDRVEMLDDGTCLIVDFKTKRKVEHEEDDFATCLQIIVYAYLMESLGYKVSGGEFRYIRLGRTVKCKYDDEMKEALDSELKLFKDAMLGGKFPCGTSNCTYCSFSDICNSSKEEEIWGGLI